MGNTGYRFLVSFFGLTLTLIVLANLVLFSGVGFFGELQAEGDVYFGYSAFIQSFKLLESMMSEYNLNGFFSMESFNTCIKELVYSLSGGVQKLIELVTKYDYRTLDSSYIGSFPSWSLDGSNIFDFFKSFAEAFGNSISWLIRGVSQIITNVLGIGEILQFLLRFIFAPIYIFIYSVWLLGFILYWIAIVIGWIWMLLQGMITSPLPNTYGSSNQWVSMVDDWANTWSTMPSL